MWSKNDILAIHAHGGIFFVVIGVYAAEQARSEDSQIKNWVIVIVLIIMGFISLALLVNMFSMSRKITLTKELFGEWR